MPKEHFFNENVLLKDNVLTFDSPDTQFKVFWFTLVSAEILKHIDYRLGTRSRNMYRILFQ